VWQAPLADVLATALLMLAAALWIAACAIAAPAWAVRAERAD
jgi:hypothetical protein